MISPGLSVSFGGYSEANALVFSQQQAASHGWSGYGDPQYVPHVMRYYQYRGGGMAEGGLLVQVAKVSWGTRAGSLTGAGMDLRAASHGAPALSAGARTSVGIWRQGLSLSSLPARKGSGGSQRGDSIIRVTMYRNPGTWCSLTGEVMAATTMWGSWNMWRRGWCTPLKGTQATAVQSVRIPLETAVSAVSEVWGSYK